MFNLWSSSTQIIISEARSDLHSGIQAKSQDQLGMCRKEMVKAPQQVINTNSPGAIQNNLLQSPQQIIIRAYTHTVVS